jgi:hypothetical protein
MLTRLSIVTSSFSNYEISELHVMRISGHFIQRNSSGIVETREDGCLRSIHVAKGKSDSNSRTVDGIILCMKNILMLQDA